MRVQSPIAGAMTGSAGKIIFQHYNGRTYGRAFPVIFHYQPTPAQLIAQNKYYGIRQYWLNTYREIKPYVPKDELKQANAYNNLTKGIYLGLGTFNDEHRPHQLRKFGFDAYDRLILRLGNYTLYYKAPNYYITFWDFDFDTNVRFNPIYAHALYLCPDLQQIQYCVVPYDDEHLTFVFMNVGNWFPNHSFEMYVALSDEWFFSNFFY